MSNTRIGMATPVTAAPATAIVRAVKNNRNDLSRKTCGCASTDPRRRGLAHVCTLLYLLLSVAIFRTVAS